MRKLLHYSTVPAMLALFFLWKIEGIEGAGNVFQALFWFIYPIAAAGSFVAFSGVIETTDSMRAAAKKNPWFSRTIALCMFAATAWFGHHVMAALVLLNIALGAALRDKVLSTTQTA